MAGENSSRTRAVLASLLFVALGGAVLLRSTSTPESQLDPRADREAGYQLDRATSELKEFLTGRRASGMTGSYTGDLIRSSDPITDSLRWMAGTQRRTDFEVGSTAVTSSEARFLVVQLWQGSVPFMRFGHDTSGPRLLGRACAWVTVRTPIGAESTTVDAQDTECPDDAPLPVAWD